MKTAIFCVLVLFSGSALACEPEGAYIGLSLGHRIGGDDVFQDRDNLGTSSDWVFKYGVGYRFMEIGNTGVTPYTEIFHESDPVDKDGGHEVLRFGGRWYFND